MSYTLDFAVALGGGMTGKTLNAQIVDTAGGSVGAAITTGFTEIGGGNYLLHCTTIPAGHRGGVKFYVSGVPGTIIAFGAINPEEGEVDLRAGTGAGGVQFDYTLLAAGGGAPIADAEVWVSTDVAGANIIASGVTDAFGVVTFWLDAGAVYVWRKKSGWVFTNPDAETVT